MGFSRREILKGMGAAGLTPLIITGCGDGGSSDPPPLPDLPAYEYSGTPGPETLFEHGVASGDPLSDGVIIWTRVSPEDTTSPAEVWWEMALDQDFMQRVAQGTVSTDASRDFTVKVDVPGLVWGRNYYYRFALQGRWSPVGRTRLAPMATEATKLRFGVCSCANYGFGYFYGFRHMAARGDLDAILHLGDYFYEYGNGSYPSLEEQVRPVEPAHETVSLEDYRIRYSLYRLDPDLQECHRQHPFIMVWDDHETANNSWMGGAENHDPETEGPWDERVAAARQALFEWIPIRDNPDRQLYRAFRYGDLADVIMLDTRIEGREKQYVSPIFSADEPNLPKNIISTEQELWLKDQITSSTAKWKIIGNQVVMSLWQLLAVDGSKTNVNEDQWNGYREGRERLLTFLRDSDVANAVVVTGDVHSSWAMDVTIGDGSYDASTREGAVAVEFVAPGITSPPDGTLAALIDGLKAGSPHIRYAESQRRGYVVLDVQTDKVQADWYLLDGIGPGEGMETRDASWAVFDGQNYCTEMSGEEVPNEEAPPLAS